MKNWLAHCLRDLDEPEEIANAFDKVLSGEATPAQTGALLTALSLSGKDQDPDTIVQCAKLLRRHAVQVSPKPAATVPVVVDIVGTGGDGFDTFNASTAAAVVVAGCGLAVAKHGNRASSSKCGSADLLEAMDCPVAALQPQQVTACLKDAGFCFLFAQTFHPAMKQQALIRKELGFPTILNRLGPLSNPVAVNAAVIGVNLMEHGMVFAKVLQKMGLERALVVHGEEGLDEISPEGHTYVWELRDGVIHAGKIHPTADFGLDLVQVDSVRGGDIAENAELFRKLLANQLPAHDPIRTFVLLNAAALLYVGGKAESYREGVQLAEKSLESGAALRALDGYRKYLKT